MVKFETTFRTKYGTFTSVYIYKLKYPVTLNTLYSQTHTHTHTYTHAHGAVKNNHTPDTSKGNGYQIKSLEKIGSTGQQF